MPRHANILRMMAMAMAMPLASALASSALAQSGVAIEVDKFGVGGYVRPGGITAVRLKLTSNLAEPTPVWVQWQVPNADGDIAEIGRSLTLTPAQPALTWLYAPLPHDTTPATVWTVRVFEERDGERRSEIGGTRISASGGPWSQGFVDIGSSMIAVVGGRAMGLDDYSSNGMEPRPVGAHEDTRVAFGISPSELPDRWEGLSCYDAVVWAGDDVPPQDLGLDQANALREYVRRGGHLIISLPAAGNPWGMGQIGQTQLEDILPCRIEGQTPRLDGGVDIAELLPVLSKYQEVATLSSRPPTEPFSIRVFKDLRGGFDVTDPKGTHYEPLLALPDGRVVAIQRWFGFGRVTVVGIDLSDGRLQGLNLPQGDAFWNRILGRRADTPTAGELKAIKDDNRLARERVSYENTLGAGLLITAGPGGINLTGKAHLGLLLAFVLFVAYWLVAGPGGFGLLKHYKLVRHAWVAFAACAALFTAIAWGTVEAIPKPMETKHITFLDQIARPPDDLRSNEPQYQRAVSFFSLYMPTYGTTDVAIESAPEQRDVLTSWTAPGEPMQFFPNVDRYRIDIARSPASYSLPSRSTSTQFYAHWMGGVDPDDWGGILHADGPITVDEGETALNGQIVNDLPGTLTNVTVIWVKNNRLPNRRYEQSGGVEMPWVPLLQQGKQLNNASMWRLDASWKWSPGLPLDLKAQLTGRSDYENTIRQRYIKSYTDRDASMMASAGAITENDRRNYIEMLSIFNQLTPPEYLKSPKQDYSEDTVAFQRKLGRELDLSPWFSRPCLIIIGFLENSDCPVPLRVDGDDESPPSDGLTVVRWIYPLPLEEEIAFREAFEAPQPQAEEAAAEPE